MTIGLRERKIDRAEFDQLMLDPHWHNALTDTPEPDRYTVIVNQYRSKDTAWIRNRYIYHSLLGWLTPRGGESVAPVLAWYEEPRLDWDKAERWLKEMIQAYEEIGPSGYFGLVLTLLPLKRRFDAGVRTQALYDQIMALE